MKRDLTICRCRVFKPGSAHVLSVLVDVAAQFHCHCKECFHTCDQQHSYVLFDSISAMLEDMFTRK